MAKTLWKTEGLQHYAENHTIQECADEYKCSYIAMQHYLLRHNIKYKLAPKGVKGNKHYLYRHGETTTRLYCIWIGMRRRCNDPKHKDFHNYGERGIKVCTEWNKDYIPFRNWALSSGYSEELTLDRIDNTVGYSPDNCRWITPKEQNNNRRSNRLVEYEGTTMTVAQWANKLGMERHALLYRLNNWSVEEAFKKSFKKSLQRR